LNIIAYLAERVIKTHLNDVQIWCGGWDSNPRTPTGRDLESHLIEYQSVKEDFVVWLKSKNLSLEHVRKIMRHLDRFAKPISKPMDLIELFTGLKDSQKRHLTNALRNLFNFYETQGLASKNWLDLLRSNLPKVTTGVDLKIPTEEEMADSIRKAKRLRDPRKFILYNLLLDSGLRLTEGVRLFNSFAEGTVEIEEQKGFCVVALGYFRGTKMAYYGFISNYTLKLLRKVNEPLTYRRGGLRKSGIISWKYLRKFVNDNMTSEKLNIPESVADFIQGRTAKSIGARHYMKLKRKAIQFYPRYAEYIAELRQKALN